MSESHHVHTVIRGRVQGVGFRFFVVAEAQRRDLTGWVRNLGSGQVEVMAEGDRPQLEGFLEALRQGPPLARVESVTAEWSPAGGEFSRFTVRSSGY